MTANFHRRGCQMAVNAIGVRPLELVDWNADRVEAMKRPVWIRPEGSFQIDIPDLGTLDFRSDEIDFLSEYGDDRRFRCHPLAGIPHRIQFKVLPGCVLMAAEYGDQLFRFDCDRLTLESVDTFSRSREDDTGFMFVRFIEANDRILVIYEQGLICLNNAGARQWHVAHGKYGFQFERIEDGKIWYADQDGNTWAYCLEDGIEVKGQSKPRPPSVRRTVTPMCERFVRDGDGRGS